MAEQLREMAEAELLRWVGVVPRGEATIRRIIAERDAAQSELAAVLAKLPRYANDEAFVPEYDPCWSMLDGQPVRTHPTGHDGKWMFHGGEEHAYQLADRAYPTAAECGEGEGR